mmetsp:Transcript_166543/g.529120  ORF Transcript_166543/g.529120 Transcript_166543/m.529120 type:complete len:184 (-) Transcript_166543:2593-3144(-)
MPIRLSLDTWRQLKGMPKLVLVTRSQTYRFHANLMARRRYRQGGPANAALERDAMCNVTNRAQSGDKRGLEYGTMALPSFQLVDPIRYVATTGKACVAETVHGQTVYTSTFITCTGVWLLTDHHNMRMEHPFLQQGSCVLLVVFLVFNGVRLIFPPLVLLAAGILKQQLSIFNIIAVQLKMWW